MVVQFACQTLDHRSIDHFSVTDAGFGGCVMTGRLGGIGKGGNSRWCVHGEGRVLVTSPCPYHQRVKGGVEGTGSGYLV